MVKILIQFYSHGENIDSVLQSWWKYWFSFTVMVKILIQFNSHGKNINSVLQLQCLQLANMLTKSSVLHDVITAHLDK